MCGGVEQEGEGRRIEIGKGLRKRRVEEEG